MGLISPIFKKLQVTTNKLHQASNKWRMKRNTGKRSVMTCQYQNVSLAGEPIKNGNNINNGSGLHVTLSV